MKKIWIINHYGDPPGPGKFTRHYNFAKKLISRGYDVKIFTASTLHTTNINFIKDKSLFREQVIDGVPFVFVRSCDYYGNGKMRIKNMFDFASRVGKAVAHYGPCDVVYASAPHSLTWLAAYRIAKKYKAKFVVETRDLWPETFISMGQFSKNHPAAKILYTIEKFIYKKADKLIFTMPGGGDYVRSIGLDDSKVSHINNGVDLQAFEENVKKFPIQDLELDSEKFKLVYTGAMGTANQLIYLIQAMEKLLDYPDVCLLIYGAGYEEDALKQYCADHTMSNVHFKGKVEKHRIPGIIVKSDLNIITGRKIPLYRYGISLNKMFEYFAAGKPILSNLECNYDIIKKYNCGITVAGENVNALVEGILQFYHMTKKEYETFCNNAHQAAKDYDFEVLTDKLEETFELER